MKINRFTSLAAVGIGILVTILAVSFFIVERNLMLQSLADDLNQNLFYIESDLRHTLGESPISQIQTVLDRAVAVNQSLSVISVSVDGVHISVSSSRSLVGQLLGKNYFPMTDLAQGFVKGHVHYQKTVNFYENNTDANQIVLLITLDSQYVFDRMNRIAFFYGFSLFIALGLIAIAVYIIADRIITVPFVRIINDARDGNARLGYFFIDELGELNRTLNDTFGSLRQKQYELKQSLARTTYLDSVLRTVADINQLLITSKNVRELMDQSVSRLARHPGYSVCMILRTEQAQLMVRACSINDDNPLCLGRLMTDCAELDAGNPFIQAFMTKQAVVVEQISHDASAPDLPLAPWQLLAAQKDVGSVIALPLISNVHDDPMGVLVVYASRVSGFDLQEIAMLEELAGDIGFAIRAFEYREQLQHHLTTDADTGLPNRVAFIDQMNTNSGGLIGLINIDRFSDINAVYGVDIGDALLKKYGLWLKARTQGREDVRLYKMGGDEFALYFRSAESLSEVRLFFVDLIAATANTAFMVAGVEIVLTITVGVAHGVDRGLAHASAAIKQAKLDHQSIGLFDGLDSTRQQENNIAWYKRIRDAIETSRIVPYFQPIVDNKTQKVTKYEALIRMIDTDGQVISPYQFLDVAKKTKLYSQLTRMMIDKVLDVFKESTIPVSINLSTEDLMNQELSDYLAQRLTETGMGHLLVFEILESEGVNNYEVVSAFIQRFKAKGCLFAIDDFGSGYSNFDHLIKLNMDILKIDGSLIRTLPHDRNSQIIVQHICDFAHEMGIRTVAEFVSNESIYHQVCEIGIDDSQGYYFYPPLERPF